MKSSGLIIIREDTETRFTLEIPLSITRGTDITNLSPRTARISVDGQNIDNLTKICSYKTLKAEEKQHQDVLVLIDDSTASSLNEAIELIEGLEEYKDFAKKYKTRET